MRKSAAIPPFWERFPTLFARPFQLESLLCLTFLATAFWLMNSVVVIGGIVRVLLDIMLFAGLLRYAFKVLEQMAAGQKAEVEWRENRQEHPYRPYKQFLALAIGVVMVGIVAATLGDVAAILASLILMLALPASIMVLALTDDLSESINPEELWRMIAGIGLPYLGLWACLSLLAGSGAAASSFLLPLLPQGIRAFLFFMINMYFVIVMYALMGYVLFQYHENLGLDVAVNAEPPVQGSQHLLTQAGEWVREGKITEAVGFLAAEVRARPQDWMLRDGYFRLLLASEAHRSGLARDADIYLGLLLGARREDQALRVLESVQKVLPDYLPADGLARAALGKAALAVHRHELALKLVKGFDLQFQNHPALPEVLFLGARLASEHLRNDAQAMKILEILLQRFPAHTIRPEAEQLQTVIARLQS